MNVRKFFRYQFSYYRNELIAFYLILIGLFTVVTAVAGIVVATQGAEIRTFSGMEFMTLIFMFVCAGSSYKAHLLMGLQNGISRKSMFISNMSISLCVAAVMCILDKVLSAAFGALSMTVHVEGFSSTYSMIFGNTVSDSKLLVLIHSLLFTFLLYALFGILGNFIVGLYCRMNRATIIIVSIGVPLALFVVLPALDHLTGNVILSSLLKFLVTLIGMGSLQGTIWTVLNPLITLAVLCGITTAALWLVMRRASVKK